IEKHYSGNSNTQRSVERNINYLYGLDIRTLDIGIVRTTHFIEKLNFGYWITPVMSMVIALYLVVIEVFKDYPIIQIAIFSLMSWIVYKTLMRTFKKRTTVIYFKELLIKAREYRLRNHKQICP